LSDGDHVIFTHAVTAKPPSEGTVKPIPHLRTIALISIIGIMWGCKPSPTQGVQGEKIMSDNNIINAKIIRAGAELGDPLILEKEEFLGLMEQIEQVAPEEADAVEKVIFGKDIEDSKEARMQAFRTSFFKGYDLSALFGPDMKASDIKLVTEYTTKALGKNEFEFKDGSSIKDPYNQSLFTDSMVGYVGFSAGEYLYLCVGHDQQAPDIEGIKVIKLPKPTETADGLKYMPGDALGDKECIVYVPKPWFGAGSQHKGFYPHDYSITLNMLIELADKGDTEFMDMVGYSFENFGALSESIGHIPNANKSWSIGDTSRTQTNTLASQALLYAEYIDKTQGKKAAKKWLRETGIPIAENDLAFLTADRAQTKEGLYLFVPIGKTPDASGGDTYAYTSEMHNSPVLHNFYFERLLDDLINTYEAKDGIANYCSETNCTKYIEEVTEKGIIEKLKPRRMKKLIKERAKLHGLTDEQVKEKMKSVEGLVGRVYVWDHPVRGEEIVIKSKASGKYYRLTNYSIGSDQAMRASGFDPSDMAGLNSLDALDTAYAGHNAQLYRQMKDMASIYKMTGNTAKAAKWNARAAKLKKAIVANMWSPKHGELVPFHQENGKVDYRFFDGSYALWAGLFKVKDKDERAMLLSIVRNVADYEGPEGPYASTDWSGHNWGWGKVWPVMAAYAFMGLRDYAGKLEKAGFKEEAELCQDAAQRIALKWLYSNAEMFAKEYGFGENLAVRPDGKPLENIYGYNVDPKEAGNYTWHVAITRWIYTELTPESKKAFGTFYAALKAEHSDKL
jgi:hypothetical protein